MKKIQIYSPESPDSSRLQKVVKKAVVETELPIEIEIIEDFNEILAAGVMQIPGLAFDGKLMLQGSIPAVSTVKNWILNDGQVAQKKRRLGRLPRRRK